MQIQSSKVNFLVGLAESAQTNDKIEINSLTQKIVWCNEPNFIHCNIVNHKVNSKQCTLHSLKGSLNSSEEKRVQKSVFQDYFMTN